MSPATKLLPAIFLTLAFPSCGTMKIVTAAKEKTAAGMSQISKLSIDKLRPARVPVVEVREKDLKDLPSGQERALAFESKKRRGFWFFGGPVDFKEPTLPASAGEMDGSLLPPIEELPR